MQNSTYRHALTLASILLFLELAACTAEPQKTVHEENGAPHMDHSLDTREILHLNSEQRHHVLTEMRQMLASTQGVIAALADNDMTQVAEAALLSAPKAKTTVDLRMADVLPDGFLPMGKTIHIEFGQIAEMANDGASKEEIITKLGDAMNLCVACHSTFQIEVVE